MKRLFLAAMVATLASCENYVIMNDPTGNTDDVASTKTFTFNLSGDFTRNYDDMTRAVNLSESNTAGITDVWLLDYSENGKLLQTVHQGSGDADFGKPSLNLAYGQHDIKLIASKGESPALSATSLTWQKVKDTYTLNYPVEVVASTNGNRSPELTRAISGVKVVMTDAVPANAKEVHVTMDRSLSLALPSLNAAEASASSNVFEVPASWVGRTGGELSTYTLCPSEVMQTDVNILILDSNGNRVSDFTVENVELKKNRMTVLTGECFGRGNGFTISIDDTWDEPLNVSF